MIKNRIKKMGHYKPPLEGRNAEEFILLDFNERTTEPSQRVKEALSRFVSFGRLQVYPAYGDAEKKIAQYAGVEANEVMISNGGDQGIDIVCRAVLDENDKVIIPYPSFPMHYQSSGIQGAVILEPRYKETGEFPLKEVLDMLDEDGVNLVIICNPNNPLGTTVSINDVEVILKKAKEKGIAVLHDEAYFEFSGVSCKDLIKQYDNLFIIRTFAKAFGLVASRVGYVISSQDNIQELLKIRGPYDVNMFAKIAVEAALEDFDYMQSYVKEVMEVSKPKLEAFLREKKVHFYPSKANFILITVSDPEKMIQYLKSQGILVRPKESTDGKMAIRISIGSSEDVGKLIDALGSVLD